MEAVANLHEAVEKHINSPRRSVIQVLLKDNSSQLNQLNRMELNQAHNSSSRRRVEHVARVQLKARCNSKIRRHQRSKRHHLHLPAAKLNSRAARKKRRNNLKQATKMGANRNVGDPAKERSRSLQRNRRQVKAARMAKQTAKAKSSVPTRNRHAFD